MLAEIGVEAEVVKVTDAMQIASHGVFGTPAVIVDDDVTCVGKVPTTEEIKGWIR